MVRRPVDKIAIAIAVALVLQTACWKGPGPAVEVPAVVYTIRPAAAAVTVGHSTAFTARADGGPAGATTWSVLEPGGGSIDAAGAYRAPGNPGVYTVRALFPADPGRSAETKVTVVAPPAGEILAPHLVLSGAVEQKARVAPVAGSTYAWSITGGRITAGSESPAVTFQAGAGPKVVLTCRVTNLAGEALNSSLEVPVAAPVTLSVSPATVTLTAGRSMKFGYSLAGGISLGAVWSLGEPGSGSLDQTGNYIAPTVAGSYTVRVTATDDPSVIAVARVQVVPRPPESLFAPDEFLPGARDLHASMPEVPGMAYAWEIDGGTLTSGADTARVMFQAGPGPSLTLRCKASNAAGDSFQAVKVLKAIP